MIKKNSTEMLRHFFLNVPTIWNISEWRMATLKVKSTITTITKQHVILKMQQKQRQLFLIVGTVPFTKPLIVHICETNRTLSVSNAVSITDRSSYSTAHCARLAVQTLPTSLFNTFCKRRWKT